MELCFPAYMGRAMRNVHMRTTEAQNYLDTLECFSGEQSPGPSCSKLTMLLVNDSLKFISSDMQIC